MLNEYDSVKLKLPLPNTAVLVGSAGVILLVYTEPWLAYEIEFFDGSMRSLGNYTVSPKDVEKNDSR